MEFHEAFTTYLNTYAGLTALVGDKISPDFISQDEDAPAIVYQFISEVVNYNLDGEQNLKEVTYQFRCYGYTQAESYSVLKQLRSAFKNYQGLMSTYYVQSIQIVARLPKYFDSITGRHSYDIDYKFIYTE
jgi:hypothetical protein